MNEDLAATIGKAARAARRVRGLTQEEVAEQLDVSTEFYARMERGAALPSVPTLVRLAPILGASSDALLGLRGARRPAAEKQADSPELRRLMRRARTLSPKILKALVVLAEGSDR